jgi:polysaccharide export outer membrane protein
VGQQVVRLPATGNETVLDAVAQVNGLTAVSNPNKVWIARPAQAGCGVVQTLPVDWKAITTGGVTDTNYQLFPGDRLYVQARPLVTLDNTIARIIAPAERLFGFTLLGAGLVGNLQSFPIQSGALGGAGNFGGVGGVR